MTRALALEEQVDALDEGRAVLDLAGWTLVDVLGADAEAWLNDLVTANVATLPLGGAVRSLLLGPTGRIRADLVVLRQPTGFLLLQPTGQPRRIDELLEPYVLSSDVSLARSEAKPTIAPTGSSGGWAVAAGPGPHVLVDAKAYDAWRIRSALPRFPTDLDEDSLPAEAGLDEAPTIDRQKGCYLGQESVAKVRNLGHPARLVVAVRAHEPIDAGQEVLAEEAPVGLVTSVDRRGDRTMALARIRWDAKDSALVTRSGAHLSPR